MYKSEPNLEFKISNVNKNHVIKEDMGENGI